MRMVARALVGAVALVGLSTGAAQADPGTPPVTADDSVTMVAGGLAHPDVLANDSDPGGEPLAVCRLGNVSSSLFAEVTNGELMIMAEVPGVYTLTYYACDYQYLTPATVTVTVTPPPVVHLRVLKSDIHPGMLKVVNKGTFRVRFEWGSYKAQNSDGHVGVLAHQSVWIHVRRVSVIWFASNLSKGAFKIGMTRGIRLPKGTNVLPPGAPPVSKATASPRWAF